VPAFTSGGGRVGESQRPVHRRGGGREAFATEVVLFLEGLDHLFLRGFFLLLLRPGGRM
jgi:hypothetical protein